MVVNVKLMSIFAKYLKNHPDDKCDLVYIFPPAMGGG